MADEKLRSTPKKSGGNKRKGASDTPRPTMAFRVHPALYEQIKGAAEKDHLTITEEVERSLTFKYGFARDAHDELFMRSIKSAFDMAEEVAGTRWFESEKAARLCHAAIIKTADLLILGLGLGDEDALNGTVNQAAVAISSVAVNKTAGFGMTEARRRYEEAVESYKHFDREHNIMVKTTSEAGLPAEWATRALTDQELAAFQAGSVAPSDQEQGTEPSAPAEGAPSDPAPKKRGRPRKMLTGE